MFYKQKREEFADRRVTLEKKKKHGKKEFSGTKKITYVRMLALHKEKALEKVVREDKIKCFLSSQM